MNVGNSCYVNAFVVALLRAFSRFEVHVPEDGDLSGPVDLQRAFVAVRGAFGTEDGGALRGALLALRNCFTAGSDQQDVGDFARYLLGGHPDFAVGLETTFVCVCGVVTTQSYETVSSIRVFAQAGGDTLADALRRASQPMSVEFEKLHGCPSCNSRTRRRTDRSWSQGSHVLIEIVPQVGKPFSRFSFPSTLELGPLQPGRSLPLLAVIWYRGMVRNFVDSDGHYYAVVRGSNGSYYQHDDSAAPRVVDPGNLHAGHPYLLLYGPPEEQPLRLEGEPPLQRSPPQSTSQPGDRPPSHTHPRACAHAPVSLLTSPPASPGQAIVCAGTLSPEKPPPFPGATLAEHELSYAPPPHGSVA